jgi:hypothetical protein
MTAFRNVRRAASVLLSSALFLGGFSPKSASAADRWYENPLGFSPLALHTNMGILLPAVAAGACLLLTPKEALFRGKVSLYEEGGFSWGYKDPRTLLLQSDAGVNVHLRRWLSVGAEFDLYFPSDRHNHTTGAAVRVFARFYPVSTDRWKLYFESGGGLVVFLDPFPKATAADPRMGTRLNGTTKYGLGALFRLWGATSVMFGIRHVHVSNGNVWGVERNPSHDSNGFFVGLARDLK